jgi:hypothetical protein
MAGNSLASQERRTRDYVLMERAREGDVVGASKKDEGKAPVYNGLFRYFPRALIAVSRVSEYGFRKYGTWGGWRAVPEGIARYSDAKARHTLKECIELYDDGDSGLAHAQMDAWNALARLDKMLEEGMVEDRIGNDIVDGKPVLGTARAA